MDRSLLRSHSMGEGTAGQIEFSTSELPDGHGDVARAPRDVLAVFRTGVCATGGSAMTMAVFSPDSCDSTHAAVRPLELPPLDGASVAHPEDISVWVEGTVSVRTRGIPGRPSPLVAVDRSGGTLPTSAFGVDSPEFLDTGDPVLCLPVPRLQRCLRVMDFASDIDPGRIFRRGRSVGPWVGHRVLSLWL